MKMLAHFHRIFRRQARVSAPIAGIMLMFYVADVVLLLIAEEDRAGAWALSMTLILVGVLTGLELHMFLWLTRTGGKGR